MMDVAIDSARLMDSFAFKFALTGSMRAGGKLNLSQRRSSHSICSAGQINISSRKITTCRSSE